MTQASSNAKPSTPSTLGAAAAAAATSNKPADSKPTDAKPSDAKPTDAKPSDTAAAGAGGAAAPKKERNASKVFVVVGTVHEFETSNKAEKFLNGEGAPTDYAVLRGKRIGTSKKVSLR